MPNKNKKRKKKPLRLEQQRRDAKPTRRLSDSVLMRILDEHMRESLSDIADIYQKVMSNMGMKSMQWKEYIKVSSSVNSNEHVLDIVFKISAWRKQCEKRHIDARPVMLIIADGLSLTGLRSKLRLSNRLIIFHLRAALALWSLSAKRVNVAAVNILLSQKVRDEVSAKKTSLMAVVGA